VSGLHKIQRKSRERTRKENQLKKHNKKKFKEHIILELFFVILSNMFSVDMEDHIKLMLSKVSMTTNNKKEITNSNI